MENMENLLNIYNQLRSCTNPDEVEELKRNFEGSFCIRKRKKESDRDSCKNFGSRELGIQNVGKSRMLSVAETSREVDNLIKEAKELAAELGKFGDDLAIEVHEEMQVQFPTSYLVGDEFASYIQEITDSLIKNKAWTIGVWGMGGVGKTTLVKHLHNMMLNEPQIYGSVYWITVSKDCNIQKLQNDVANRIGASISGMLDELQRAGILAKTLKRKKKFVLILDDVWSDYDLNEVGLGFPKKIGYRLIVTSRSKDVCLKMYCDNIIKVNCLSKEDAWTLFVRSIGREIPDNVKKISIDVLEECAGLPLGIITLGKSMIGCNDVCEWRSVLDELRNPNGKVDDMEDKVFKVLKLSYERLKDREIEKCLLYCATYPEDYEIEINELIWLFIDAKLLGGNVGIAKMFDKGLTILRKLERVALLSIKRVDSNDKKYVSLHDLIRDMALQIAGPRFMIKDDVILKDILDEESWTNELEVVSFMQSQIVEISDLSPKCTRLSALLFQKSRSLSVLCDGFFRYLDGLKLLDLSNTGITTLSESISLLKNLTALILRDCSRLQNVPSLAKLTSLERLDLYGCSAIGQLPKGIRSLIKLRYLNLYFIWIKRIGVGVISKLTALQYLAIYGTIDVNELNSLNNLEHLTIWFEDFVSFSTFIQQLQIKGRPHFYRLFVGNFSSEYVFRLQANRNWRLKEIYLSKTRFNQYDGLERIIFGRDSTGYSIVDDIHDLDICDDKGLMSLGDYVFDSACNVQRQSQIERGSKPFSNLKLLRLSYCPNLKKLFPLGLLSNFANIESIYIGSCEGLEELIEEAGVETKLVEITKPKTFFSLPKLKHIYLKNLPNLKRFCKDDEVIRIPLLSITVMRCPKLKRIPLDILQLSVQEMVYLEEEKEWLELLEWDPPESKSRLQFWRQNL